MQHTQPFRSCVLLLKCFNYMDAFAECNLLRLPFLKAICFSKQTAGLILIYLSKFLSTPTLSHRRYIKQGYEFLAKLYQAALLSFVFYLLSLRITSQISWVAPWPYWILWQPAVKDGALCACKFKMLKGYGTSTSQVNRISFARFFMLHFSMLHFGRAKESTREITER